MNNQTSKTSTLLITAICFLAFFLFGLTDNLKGPTLPPMLAELNINYGTGGNIFFSEYVGFLIATLVTGILADRFGLKLVIVLAGVFLAIGVGGYSLLNTPFLLSASIFIIGIGLGAFELGPNAVIVSIYHKQKGLYLNLMSVMHGLGSMIAPLFASWLFSMEVSWRIVYRWDLLLIGVFLLLALLLKFPQPEEKSALDFRSIPQVAFRRHMPFYYVAMLFYVASEIGLASWMVVYLQDARGLDTAASNNYLAFFFGMLMLGRFLGSFIVSRLGYLLSTLLASLLAIISLVIGIFTSFSLFLPLTGLFFSIIFPTLTAAASDAEHENTNTILGVLFTFSGLGGVVGPWLVAWSSDLFGLQAGFTTTLLLTGLTFLFILILYKRSRHEQNT
ncbi:MAG: MFS transporter [Anaerolineales bacterium]|nr:MFS transporter [Anaerolineales bacterium]